MHKWPHFTLRRGFDFSPEVPQRAVSTLAFVTAKGQSKQPHYITAKDGSPLAFAGLWSRWRDIETDQEVFSATIIVTNANETLRPIHDRMPGILEHENVAQWLSGDGGADLLVPAAEEKLTSWPVSTRVNKAGSADGATLIDRVS